MKKIIFITLSAIFVLSGCKSKEDKALEVIKNQMFQTLYDFESYQPIETKIDSAFLSIYTDSAIIRHGYIKVSICNRLLLNILQVISQKYGLNL